MPPAAWAAWPSRCSSGLGFQVTAVTSKTTADDYLKSLGASDIFHLKGKELGTKPLEKVLWGGAVDNLGGATLAWLTRTVAPYGSIASIGLAQGPELNTTVMPFILRGVSLLGINSVEVPLKLRAEIWRRLAGDLKPANLGQDRHPGSHPGPGAGRGGRLGGRVHHRPLPGPAAVDSLAIVEDLLRQGLPELGIPADEALVAAFASYLRLLAQWNENINLTGIRELADDGAAAHPGFADGPAVPQG